MSRVVKSNKLQGVLSHKDFMDDMYLALICNLKTDDLKKIAYKHKIKLTVDLLNRIRDHFKKNL